MTVKLTDLKIKNLIPEDKKYKVWDAVVSGMYVLVRPSGSRMFVLRVREFNKQKEITIGAYGLLFIKLILYYLATLHSGQTFKFLYLSLVNK